MTKQKHKTKIHLREIFTLRSAHAIHTPHGHHRPPQSVTISTPLPKQKTWAKAFFVDPGAITVTSKKFLGKNRKHHCLRKGGGGVLIVTHGRSRNDHSPSRPYKAGTEHVGFSSAERTSPAPSAKRREAFGESRGRRVASFSTKNRLRGGLSCVWMTAWNE